MRMRTQVRFAAVLLVAWGMTGAAWAQSEQWLQYRCAREARQIVPDMGYSFCELSFAKPEGVKLPEFKAQEPLFLEWKTPMTATGVVWLAFDKSNPSGQYDRLYIDGNANGDLSDDPACEPYQQDGTRSLFGPVKIVFSTPDGAVSYHLSADMRIYAARQAYCLLTSAGWYEGDITLDGVRKHCTLIDYNINGAFNDKSADAAQCDRIRIGEAPGRGASYVGNLLEVGDKLYRPKIAKDGAFIVLTEATDVSFGTVRVAESITSLGAGGLNGLFQRKPDKGLVKLPVGDYRIEHWTITREDNAGGRWELRADSSAETTAFTVASGQEKELPFGEPVYSMAEYRKSASSYDFRQRLQGRHEERITLTRNGSQPTAPKLRIRSRDGAYDRSLSFEYG